MRSIRAADLFCGAGGTSAGMKRALERLGYKPVMTAINHWDVAVATYKLNNPEDRAKQANLDMANPMEFYKEGELDILWASPECTHHSIARGGKPINDQSRATAMCVVRWAEALKPSVLLIENVREFRTWGPSTRVRCKKTGKLIWRPDPKRKCETFMAWIKMIEAIGYRVDYRVLRAADYGDPTTRERLFVMAVRGKMKIVWPDPVFAKDPSADLLDARLPWRTARDHVIDWSLEGKSIFDRKRALSPKTMARLWAGLEMFGIKPFIVPREGFYRGNANRGVDKPVPTVTTAGGHNLAEPFLIRLKGTRADQIKGSGQSTNAPVTTVQGSNHYGLAEPFLVQVNHGNDTGKDKAGNKRRTRKTDQPLPTICGHGEWAVVEPCLLGQQSGAVMRPISEPSPTVATAGAIRLCEAFIMAIDHQGGNGKYVEKTNKPISTITTESRHALVEPFLIETGGPAGKSRKPKKVDAPLGTVMTNNHTAVIQPFLVYYNRTGNATGMGEPVKTVTSKERIGMVRPVVEINGDHYVLDIKFRMLQVHELAAAQGFPKGYKFTGTKTEQVKQIGNAVPCHLAEALVLSVMSQDSRAAMAMGVTP